MFIAGRLTGDEAWYDNAIEAAFTLIQAIQSARGISASLGR